MWFERHHRVACRKFEAMLEDALEPGGEGSVAAQEVLAHLQRCRGCREAFEAAQLAREFVRSAREPAPEPGPAFSTRVLAGIREEEARRSAAVKFWRPLELLASRVAVAVATLLLLLSVYLLEFGPARHAPPATSQSEVTDGFPQPDQQPRDHDEVLLTLAENFRGR